MKPIRLAILMSALLSSTCTIAAVPGEQAMLREMKNIAKKESCSTQPLSMVQSNDQKLGAVVSTLDGCGGGNNWVNIVQYYDGKTVRSYTAQGTVDRVFFDETNKLVANVIEYGPNDPRCCPSIKKQIVLFTPPASSSPVSHQALNWERMLDVSLRDRSSCYPVGLPEAIKSSISYSNNRYRISNPNPVNLDLQRPMTIRNNGDHSVISMVPRAFVGPFPVSSVSYGLGHENGIGFFSFVIQGNPSQIQDFLRKERGVKIGQRGLAKTYKDNEFMTLNVIPEGPNGVAVNCDYSD